MIVSPNIANRRPYTNSEYNKLTKKFCEICQNDLASYMALLEYVLRTKYDKDGIIDKKIISRLRKDIIDHALDYDEAVIFINSIFLEIVAPFHYSKIMDLQDFLGDFPYKKCSDYVR